jgi:hypothetical protein
MCAEMNGRKRERERERENDTRECECRIDKRNLRLLIHWKEEIGNWGIEESKLLLPVLSRGAPIEIGWKEEDCSYALSMVATSC